MKNFMYCIDSVAMGDMVLFVIIYAGCEDYWYYVQMKC